MLPAEIIAKLELKPHPKEGGYFRETYASNEKAPGSSGPLSTQIYYLLTAETFSAFHRLSADEVWHFYAGDPVQMINLRPDKTAIEVTLGANLLSGDHLQYVVPAHTWQAARLREGGSFALMGCTMAPGFTPERYEHGQVDWLKRQYPGHAAIIEMLCTK